eukprot:4435282-Prymnesium_polylepis.1
MGHRTCTAGCRIGRWCPQAIGRAWRGAVSGGGVHRPSDVHSGVPYRAVVSTGHQAAMCRIRRWCRWARRGLRGRCGAPGARGAG